MFKASKGKEWTVCINRCELSAERWKPQNPKTTEICFLTVSEMSDR